MIATRTFTELTTRDYLQTAFLYPASIEFDGHERTIVEVGPGRGDFLFNLAKLNPEALIVGIEIKRKRVDKLISRVEARRLNNVMIIQDDAECALPRFLRDNSVDEIHINFPDPWPKQRHSKNRTVSTDFLNECKRALKIGGTIHFITDFYDYAKAVFKNASSIPELETHKVEADVFPTYFALKWKRMGRAFTYYKFRRLA